MTEDDTEEKGEDTEERGKLKRPLSRASSFFSKKEDAVYGAKHRRMSLITPREL